MQMRGAIAGWPGYVLHANAWEGERFLADVGAMLDLGDEVLSNRFWRGRVYFDQLSDESVLEQSGDFLDVARQVDGDANA